LSDFSFRPLLRILKRKGISRRSPFYWFFFFFGFVIKAIHYVYFIYEKDIISAINIILTS
jgi:hypothetical protein